MRPNKILFHDVPFLQDICAEIQYDYTVTLICTKYRIYPTHAQETFLEETLETCRGIYNSLLNSRKFEYEVHSKSFTLYDQINAITEYKNQFIELTSVHSQVLQNVAVRVDLAFKAFFRRIKDGETPGFPRMKGEGYDSFCYPGSGFAVNSKSIRLSKIGVVKAVIHRRVEGAVKTCTIKRQGGKWFATFAVETDIAPLPNCDDAVGIDVGIEKFAALSNNTYIDNPRFFRSEEQALAKAQRKAATFAKKTKERNPAKKVIARIHERIRNKRHNFIHQQSRRIVNAFGVIAVEQLTVKNMTATPKAKPDPENEGVFLPNGASQKAGLNKSILDASWSMFRSALAYKAFLLPLNYHTRNRYTVCERLLCEK